jgi:hypothetical protein
MIDELRAVIGMKAKNREGGFGCWGAMEQLWKAFHNCSTDTQTPHTLLLTGKRGETSKRPYFTKSGQEPGCCGELCIGRALRPA